MNITVIAPCFYPDDSRIEYFLKSAERYGIKIYQYGYGKPFKHWIDTHIDSCLDELKHMMGTHVLFTDSSDVIFLQSLEEIRKRYIRLGYPKMLVSEEETGMNAGGWIGEISVAIYILEYLKTQTESGDPQKRWRQAALRQQITVQRDVGSAIFNVGYIHQDSCLWHFAGGYTDPLLGKKELMAPYWKELGY